MRKKYILVKISNVWCFLKSTRPVYYQFNLIALKFDIRLHSKPFSSKIHIFAFLMKKKRGLKDKFSERPLIFCPLNCTYIDKN